MITGDVKNKVDAIWTSVWAGGITNPITVIEQLSYLMFIRSLDERELDNEKFERISGAPMPRIFPQTEAGQSMRWSRFKNQHPGIAFEIVRDRVFPAIKRMEQGRLPDPEVGFDDQYSGPEASGAAFSVYMKDATFDIPTPLVLQEVITGLDDLYEHDIKGLDMQGDLYEYMLGKLSTAGQNGQFRTPKHIREMMVELIAPTPDDSICDPACGTAGFLISSAEYIRRNYESTMTQSQWDRFKSDMFTGYDTDKTMLRISAMNLMLHSIDNPRISYNDSVSADFSDSELYTVCLANPPFKGTVNSANINDSLKVVVDTKKTELLFLALFLRIMRRGGRCACIVPNGVLFGSSKAHREIRRQLIDDHKLVAVISMPSGVFRPYAGVSTAVLVFVKTGAGGTDRVWFYDMQADGFSLDDKRAPVSENDIPDIVARFKDLDAESSRQRTDKSFMVPVQEIRDNGYELSINKYKKIEHVQEEYTPTKQLIAEIRELNKELTENLDKLERML